MQTAFREPRFYIARGLSVSLFEIDFFLATLFFCVVASPFQYDELLLYPMALYFAYALVRDRYLTWPILQRAWPMFLFPIWWILSSLWSPEPMLAFRSGIQALLSMFICVFFATRLNSRQLLLVGAIAMIVIALRSIPQVQAAMSINNHAKGIFAHKNQFGAAMSVFCLLLLGTTCCRRLPSWLRLGALGMLPFGLFMLLRAESATATLTTVGLFGIVVGGLVFVGQRQLFTPLRIVLVSSTMALAFLISAVAINVLTDNPIDLLLGALGKDRTLTGRTGLWEVAVREIAERPVLGTGPYGYWLYFEKASTRHLFDLYHLEPSSTFQFHNSWLNIGVEFGLIGVCFAMIGFLHCVIALSYRAFARGEAEDWALIATVAAVAMRTMVESDFYQPFIMLNSLMFVGALIPMGYDRQLSKPVELQGHVREWSVPKTQNRTATTVADVG